MKFENWKPRSWSLIFVGLNERQEAELFAEEGNLFLVKNAESVEAFPSDCDLMPSQCHSTFVVCTHANFSVGAMLGSFIYLFIFPSDLFFYPWRTFAYSLWIMQL